MENSHQRFKRRIPLDGDEAAGTPPKAKAKRCLFGAVNHEDLIKDLRKITDKLNADSQKKWNFDFATETPLTGRFDWTKVDMDEVPTAYRMPHLTARLSEGLNFKSVDESSSCETQRKTQQAQLTACTSQPFVAKATLVDKENVVCSSLSTSRNQRLGGKRKANSSRKSAQKDNSAYRTQSKIIDHFQQRKIKSEVRRKLDL